MIDGGSCRIKAHPTGTENSESVYDELLRAGIESKKEKYSPLNCLDNVFNSRLSVHGRQRQLSCGLGSYSQARQYMPYSGPFVYGRNGNA
jgi:hypothetical protein